MCRTAIPSPQHIALILAILAQAAAAEEVTIDELLAKVPVLSPDNEELECFRLTGVLPTAVRDFPVRLEMSWSRPNRIHAFYQCPASRIPFAFFADNQMMLLDPAEGSIKLGNEFVPNIEVRVKTESIAVGCGMRANHPEGAKVLIDLPSFLRGGNEPGTLTQKSATRWQLTQVSVTKNSSSPAFSSEVSDFSAGTSSPASHF